MPNARCLFLLLANKTRLVLSDQTQIKTPSLLFHDTPTTILDCSDCDRHLLRIQVSPHPVFASTFLFYCQNTTTRTRIDDDLEDSNQAMETVASGTVIIDPTCNRRLTKKVSSSSSFRLRCPSLNSLRLRRIFDLFDKNGDGMITTEELNQALNLLGLDADLSDLDFTISCFIQPGNVGLTFEDFAALHQSLNDTYFGGIEDQVERETSGDVVDEAKMSQEDSDLSEAFRVFDEDGDGYISAKELQVVLRKLGLSEGNEIDRVQKMIVSVDRNQDGRVDFFEFKDMMRSVIIRSC